MEWYQQGDVLLKPIDKVPDEATPLLHTVLAEGEATGHSHVAHGEGLALLEAGHERYLVAPAGASIVHEEHKPIRVPAGAFRVERVREYDHFAEFGVRPRPVRD